MSVCPIGIAVIHGHANGQVTSLVSLISSNIVKLTPKININMSNIMFTLWNEFLYE